MQKTTAAKGATAAAARQQYAQTTIERARYLEALASTGHSVGGGVQHHRHEPYHQRAQPTAAEQARSAVKAQQEAAAASRRAVLDASRRSRAEDSVPPMSVWFSLCLSPSLSLSLSLSLSVSSIGSLL